MTKPAPDADLRARLRAAGLRATLPRLSVLRHLTASRSPLSHGDVAARLEGELDRATVYRNLMDLTTAGLARRTDLGDHVWRFEFLDGDGHGEAVHPHFICGSCGTVTCLPEDTVSMRVAAGAPRALKRRKGLVVQLRGLCDACI